MTIKEQIIAYMKEHGSISEYEAMKHLHSTSLRSRISELRLSGVNITDTWEKGKNGERYKRYRVEDEES